VVVTGATGQPALAVYMPADDGHVPFAIKVLTIQSGLIAAITGFVHVGPFDRFGLPSRLPVD